MCCFKCLILMKEISYLTLVILSLQNVFGIICEHVCFVHCVPLIAKNVTLDFFHH